MTLSRYVLMGALLAPAIAGPAAAEDCFPKVRAAETRPAAPPKASVPAMSLISGTLKPVPKEPRNESISIGL